MRGSFFAMQLLVTSCAAVPTMRMGEQQLSPFTRYFNSTVVASLDRCVESWRLEHRPNVSACNHCHSITSDKYDGLKIEGYQRLIRAHVPNCRTVCETGFNRGDSALLWLELCPAATVHSFTLDWDWYTRPGLDCIRAMPQQGPRLVYHEGSTGLTLPPFAKRVESGELGKCDIIHVDGCKDMHCRASDLAWLKRASHNATLFLTDDLSLACPGAEKPCCATSNGQASACSKAWSRCSESQAWVVPEGRNHHDMRRNAQIFTKFAAKERLDQLLCVPTRRCLNQQFDAVCGAWAG